MLKKLCKLVLDPYTVIGRHKVEFFLWFVFTIVVGQLGILANIVVRYYSYGTPISVSIYLDSISGSFYVFSIATVASMLGPLFVNILEVERLSFKTLKVIATVAAIFFLFFSGIVYSAIQSKSEISTQNLNLGIDVTQFLIYLGSILLCLYMYCILKLEKQQNGYAHLNDPVFAAQEDLRVEQVAEQGNKVEDDGKGNKL